MRRLMMSCVVLLVPAGQLMAQPPGPFQRQPTQSPLSPYLSLTLGRDAAVNYYNGVRLDRQVRSMQDRITLQETLARRQLTLEGQEDELPTLPETGHVVRFMNYGPYYGMGQQQPSAALYPLRPAPKKR